MDQKERKEKLFISSSVPGAKDFMYNNTETHPQHPSIKIKLEALKRCFDNGEDVKAVSLEIGYSRASIYTWRRKFEKKGMLGILGRQDDIPRKKDFY